MKWSLGEILYLVGVPGALILGALQGLGALGAISFVPIIMVLVGIGIGIMNIQKKEVTNFMLAALLLGSASLITGLFAQLDAMISGALTMLAAVMIPAGIVVGLKVVWVTAKK